MKKTLLTSFLLSLGFVNAQTFVPTTAQNKKVILEEFTGVNCVFCPQGHTIANNIKKAIISANNAIASVKANPKIAILKSSSFKEGFRDVPKTKAPKTVPIPIPAPANPIVANPAPRHFAACNNIKSFIF